MATDCPASTAPAREPTLELVALAFGLAAKIGRKFGLSDKQAAELIQNAYEIISEPPSPAPHASTPPTEDSPYEPHHEPHAAP